MESHISALNAQMDRITVLEQDRALLNLMTIIRDRNTNDREFSAAVEKIVRRLITSALNHVPAEEYTITTPIDKPFKGIRFTKGVCGVSILRAGACMEQALRDTWTGRLSFGKLLIQRDEETSIAKIYYSKLPTGISNDIVLLLEPMLATGGSVIKAVENLTSNGVPEESIVLVNVVSSKKGLEVVSGRFPGLKIVSAAVDAELTAQNYISPGLGDFGDRYYGTSC
ncbi:uracil phosphoribosyltransferase [Aspergillus ibericus CBS 121593]|uniref:uracil phosphoribosyltransferase n=1 Tax=Aspergillus ibericus CBS 121593 TaxID=1448316 RepID=A0A395GLD3_9EURO|nr:PRTase-like protein [Aspergillus ibericus CBS 121593]RAK95637.1 PRTase-like protein [Aspergillus ibericus CBS 121593]